MSVTGSFTLVHIHATAVFITCVVNFHKYNVLQLESEMTTLVALLVFTSRLV